jgi:excisionase family DNA binding protein
MTEATQIGNLEDMLTLKEVRDVLGVSYGVILGHIRNGHLRAYKVTGEPVGRNEVGDKTLGIRVRPSDLREYLTKTLIK